MVKLLKAEFDIFAAEKHGVNEVDYKGTTNANGQAFKQNIKP